jgi:hypothetical protein
VAWAGTRWDPWRGETRETLQARRESAPELERRWAIGGIERGGGAQERSDAWRKAFEARGVF